MTARPAPTEELLDALAAALVPTMEAISDVAWEAMGSPRGAQHIPLPPRTEKGLGRLTCPGCGQATTSHSLDGSCPA